MQVFKGKGPEFWHWRYMTEKRLHQGTAAKARLAHKALRQTLQADLYGTHWIERAFMCIHGFEGSWTDSGAPYYGGLQMDEGFQRSYGREFYDKFGTADKWPISVQLAVGIKAYLSGRGFGPWPNTARYWWLALNPGSGRERRALPELHLERRRVDTYGDEPQERSSEDVTGFETSAGFAPLADYACDTCVGYLTQVRGEWTCLRCGSETVCETLDAEVRKLREEKGMTDEPGFGPETHSTVEYPAHPTAEIPVAPEPEDYPCKIEGCPNRTTANRGPYAYLCEEHKSVSKVRQLDPPPLNGKVGATALDEALEILELEREQLLQTVAQLESAIDTVRSLRDARA
jgi:hypothetical protein